MGIGRLGCWMGILARSFWGDGDNVNGEFERRRERLKMGCLRVGR